MATTKKAAAAKAPAKKSAAPARKATASAPAKKASATNTAAASKKAAPARKAANGNAANGRLQSHNDLDKIFKDTLKDIYWAEKNLMKGLKKMAKNATNSSLAEAYNTHMAQTEDQIAKLEEAFGILGMKAQGVKCEAMAGLLKEGEEHMEEYEKGPGLDAALIIAAQKIEHYEISSYGSLRTLAEVLGYNDCATIFEEIKEQEEETDDLLTELASNINREAVGAHNED